MKGLRLVLGIVCAALLCAGEGLMAAEAPPQTLAAALVRIAELEERVAELEARLVAAGAETARLEVVAGLEAKAGLATAADARFDVRYDATTGRSVVVGPVLESASNLGLSNTRFLLAPAVTFLGEQPTKPAPVFHLFVASRGHTHNRLRTLKTAEVVVDGTSIEVPVSEYLEEGKIKPPRSAGRARRGAVAYDERLRLTLDRSVMTRLAYATQTSLRLREVELTLTREQLAVVRATLLRGTPADPRNDE